MADVTDTACGVVTLSAAGSSAEEMVRRVDSLDLEPVVFKLVHPEPGDTGLSVAGADQAVALYRGFLKLCALYPGVTLVPTRDVDQVWHAHMLDTAKYRADCDEAFGRFIDHFPYAGLRGEQDQRFWADDFARTRQLFLQHFGVDLGVQAGASVCHNHGDGSDCCVGSISRSADIARPRLDRG